MNLDDLQKKLMSAARKSPPEDRVPHAFEKRVMARLSAPGSPLFRPDEWVVWARSLWYGASVCASVALLIGVWSVLPDADRDGTSEFSQDIEKTILASVVVDDEDNDW